VKVTDPGENATARAGAAARGASEDAKIGSEVSSIDSLADGKGRRDEGIGHQ
jgi:hypothetical protein